MDPGRGSAQGADPRVLAAAYTAGVLILHALPQLPAFALLVACCLPALLPWRWRSHYAAFALGALITAWSADTRLQQRWPAERHNQEIWATGRIVSLPELNRAETGDGGQRTWRFQFEPDARPGEPPLPSVIRASWYRTDSVVRGGECWRFKLRLRTPHGSLNPGGFDYEAWLFGKRIGATATVREAEPCGVASGLYLLKLRQQLVERYAQWLPQHPALPLVAALTVGDDSGLRNQEWHAFRVTGTTHLVAISGFNIAIVAGLAFFLMRWTWSLFPPLCLRLPAQRAALLGSALIGLAYAGLAGWDAPVQRAALMLLLVLAAAWFHRLNQPSRVLALAWMLMLLLDPFAVLSPGLWLSFGAVAAIFYVSSGRLRQTNVLREVLTLQLMLSVVLAPLTLYFFHGAAWLSPLVNLLAVPVAAVLTPLLLLGVLLALAWPAAGVPLLGLVASALEQLRDGLLWLAAHAPESWMPASPAPVAALLALAGAVLLFAPRGLPLKPLALLCFAPLLLPPDRAPRTGYELAALDVGQGLAVVVRTAGHVLLYDAGPAFDDGFDAGESVVAPYLLHQGLRSIDLLVLSHGDNDHAGGVPAVRRLLRVEREIGTDGHEPCRAGQAWEWDGVRFELLHPDADGWSGNNSSCVLRVSDGRHVALLAGDIEADAEAHLLAQYPRQLRADLLIAPHHGSKTSSTEGFVAAVRPQLVIYGAAWRSHYGHPRPEVVQRWRSVGARQYVTGLSGALIVPADSLEVRQWRRQAARFWNAPAEAPPEPEAQSRVGFGASP